jgi:hypothetical protein
MTLGMRGWDGNRAYDFAFVRMWTWRPLASRDAEQATMASQDEPTHLDIHDRSSRQAYARLFGVTEEQLRKAARLVGTRVKTLRSHLAR